MRTILKKSVLFLFLGLLLFLFGNSFSKNGLKATPVDYFPNFDDHSYDDLPNLLLPDETYLSYTYFRNNIGTNSTNILAINPETWGKIIRFDTAEELYRFSIDVSYNLKYTQFETKLTQNAIGRLMSFHYVLGKDIDYSVMKSKRFNPIGYDFSLEGITYSNHFTGIFDGQGFEIRNLYFSGFDELVEILNPGTELETQVAYTEYYSMFAYNDGIIKNFGLINPTFEFYFESSALYKASYIVGKNNLNGEVSYIYAIDTRTALVGGIRMVASAGLASGVMFENHGLFHDAYFASRVVINASYGSRFTVQPVLYLNETEGVIYDLAFDDTLYQETVTVGGSSYNITTPNSYAESMTTTQIRSSNEILGNDWYYYPAQNDPTPKYPSVLGLNLVSSPLNIILSDKPGDVVTLNTHFEINNAKDLIAFSKILNYNRQTGLTPYRELNYVIKSSFDMNMVSPESYQTPSIEFSGTLAGINQNIYINGLEIINGYSQQTYDVGMFSVLSGKVLNLIFYNASVAVNNTDLYAGIPTNVGLITGQLSGGVIRNVLADVDIDLGHQTLGELNVGSLVGSASGWIQGIYAEGEIQANQDHIYNSSILINPNYQIGGLIGNTQTTQSLTLIDAYNKVNIHGPGSTSTSMLVSETPKVHMGGVIGKVNNAIGAVHTVGLLTNDGKIYVNHLQSQHATTQYVGGVIGMSSGISYEINPYFGKLRNLNEIDVLNRGSNQVISAGILTSNHTQETEFVHLYNEPTSKLIYYTTSPASGNFNNLSYTTLVNNVGSGLIISQARNRADMEMITSFDFSGVYISHANSHSLLRFVENKGNIIFKDQTITQTVNISGISLSLNISYLNVSFDGNIHVYNMQMETDNITNKELFISGITRTLSNSKYIRNSLVNGEIIVANIRTNTVNRNPRNNIYVGGFVNYNLSGNMDPNGNQAMPKATIGIINSINRANIVSTYNVSQFGILGHANVYAGGIATFNDGDIQDSANIGDIRIENLSDVDAGNVTFNTDSTTGGSTTKLRYGTIIGGVAAAVLSSRSRIYDSINSGTIIGLSRNFSRVGGILGIAIYREIEFGNADPIYSSVTTANIKDSILSNCINYGNVSALTITISIYSNSNTTQTMSGGITNNYRHDITTNVSCPSYNTFYCALSSGAIRVNTRTSTQERPGINAAAGGVIGYGLSIMRRMMNHGQVSSTDVAGGVVGATVVLVTEYVKIDTAINYGTVRAFDLGTNDANFLNVNIMDYETIRDGFYDVNDPFIFPNVRSDMRLYPENKRGFGGIFGRLQRAANQIMYGNNDANSTFNFIVNLDPNVDLIGRLDQVYNYLSSLRYFDFRNAVYYSARKNDTTQAVFTGVSYFFDNSNTVSSGLRATRTVQNITITSRKYEYSYDSNLGQWMRTTYESTNNRSEIILMGRRFERYGFETPSSTDFQMEVISRSIGPSHSSGSWTALSNSTVAVGTLNEYKTINQLPYYNQVWDIESSKTLGSSSFSEVPNGYYVFGVTFQPRIITEDPNDTLGEYTYDPSFDMITDPTLQDFIYYAENGNLSETFKDARPNGMYVLSTSSGSTFGANLPRNLIFDQLLPLALGVDGSLPSNQIDYDSGLRMDVSNSQTYMDLLDDYVKLFQTEFSDKSQLLDNQPNIRLSEIGGTNTILYNPTIVQPTSGNLGTMTFNVHLGLYDLSPGGMITIDYELLQAMLPDNAIIAKTIEDYYGLPYGSDVSQYLSEYRQLLYDYADPNVPEHLKPDLKPILSFNINASSPSSGVFNIGYISSYSQLSQNITSFLSDHYVTDYQIRLNVTYNPSFTAPYLYSYQVDGGSQVTTIQQNIPQLVNSTLRFNFRNPQVVLPIGTDIMTIGTDNYDNVQLYYYDPLTSSYILVDQEDYQISIQTVQNASFYPFNFILTLGNQLRGGQYRIEFRLLPYQETKDFYTFTKSTSTTRSILSLEHYSSGVITPSGTSISSQINFGYPLDLSDLTLTPVYRSVSKPYLDDVLYYELPFLNQITISPFAQITNISIGSITYNASGYKIYNITYSVQSESGLTTVYTHQITERAIQIKDVFRNNNKVVMNSSNPVLISREAFSTTVSINYGVDPLISSDIYNLFDDNPDSYFDITPSDVLGVEFSVTDTYLVFTIDYEADSGNYQFDVVYRREGHQPINLGSVYIRKLQGTNAYLFDIAFAELATETNYPMIYVSNALGVPITSPYSPSVYFAGIDYDGADLNGVTQFRIDGQVSNIPLDSYIPLFLNHLPAGATIARKLSDSSYTQEISGPFDPNLGVLAGDFTSSEGSESDDIIITYRVTSEDGLNVVYYHITVIDITYNVSYLFDVIYQGNSLKPNLDGLVIVINVRNMTTNIPVGDQVVETLPVFTTVTGYTNSTNLFFMLNNESYRFRFGRNKSGFFSFNVKVLDPEGYQYSVKIELNGTDLLLPVNSYDVNSIDEGKYYYINSSTRNRTRSFVITIYDAKEKDRDFGFTDSDESWKNE